MPEDLVPLPCPESLTYLWNWWAGLAARRGGGFGPRPISWQDLEAWARLTGIALSPFELEVLSDLEQAYLRIRAKDSA